MKREAQRQREEAARVTKNGLDCSVLADRTHLPITWHLEPQLTTPKEDLAAQRTHFGQSKASTHSQHPDPISSPNILVDEDLPATSVAPPSFYCQEISEPISLSQRAGREAMKREAQRQREEAARVTSKGLDCSVKNGFHYKQGIV